MQHPFDYRKFAVLYVDDEVKSLKYFRLFLDQHFRIFTAINAEEGFNLFMANREDIAVLVTDQRMPGEKGVSLLKKIRNLNPRTIRILVTAFSDIDVTIQAVNSGAIYKYFSKPIDFSEMEMSLRRALEFFIVQYERDQLLKEKLSALHNLVMKDRVISLGIMASGLGHYVRNALVAVRTFLDLAPEKLMEELEDPDCLRNPNYWKDFYKHVQGQISRISGMLSDLGMASESSTATFEDTIHLKTLIGEAAARLNLPLASKNISLKLDIPDDLPALKGEMGKIKQLFHLILNDEIKNLPRGSHIELRAHQVRTENNSDQALQVVVKDDGLGLPREALGSVFDPFYLRGSNQQEFGINLMACYFIVYHHGGKVNAEGGGGEGTTFTFTFPLNPKNRWNSKAEEEALFTKILDNTALWEKLMAGN